MARASDPRALHFLGRRIERLFFTGVVLIFLCAAEIYLSTAARQIANDRTEIAVSTLLVRLSAEQETLTDLFRAKPTPAVSSVDKAEMTRAQRVDQTRKLLGLPPAPMPNPDENPAKPTRPRNYVDSINLILTQAATKAHLRVGDISQYVDPTKPPLDNISALKKHHETLVSKTTNVLGVETPRLLAIQYAGLDYKVPFGLISAALASALAPLLIGWMAAMYITRQRELVILLDLEDYKVTFPHVLNLLPVRFERIEKRYQQRYRPLARTILAIVNRVILSVLRSSVLLLFVFPMVFAFTYSLYQLWQGEEAPTTFFFVIGATLIFIMSLQALMLVVQEWYIPWGKEFYE